MSDSYLKPIFFSFKQIPSPSTPSNSTSFPIFPFSFKSITISSIIRVCLKAGCGEEVFKIFFFNSPFFHAVCLVMVRRILPLESSSILLFFLRWIGDHLCSSLNFYYLKDRVWLLVLLRHFKCQSWQKAIKTSFS